MHRLWLIGLREFKAYVATASFWVALAVGPILMLAAAGLLAASSAPTPPLRIVVAAEESALRADAAAAMADAAALVGRPVIIDNYSGQAMVKVTRKDGALTAWFGGAELPEGAKRLFKSELERRLALRRLASADPSELDRGLTVDLPPPAPPAKADPQNGARFGLVFMLWLTLTGSLGMLLQAVVRERANRALDSLMAAAQPVEIVFGKLLGVGAVSVLVLSAWVGTAAALGGLAPAGATGPVDGALGALANPMLLIQAAGVYVLTYVMYGSVTIALGAKAQDVASAQNLSRPMFGVLLIAFFAALASVMGAAAQLSWMIWIPPLTPFMLLLAPGGTLSAAQQLAALGVTALGAMACGALAARSLTGKAARASGARIAAA